MPGSSPGMTGAFCGPLHFPKKPSLRAQRSNPSRQKESMDCFAALAMTPKHAFALATPCARGVDESSAQRGRGERRMPVAPAASCALVVVERTRVTTSTPESPDVPARNGFNGFLRALVSAKSARMWERAVLTNRPLLDLSPFVLEGL